jgi:hypothetical protein
VDGCQPGDVVIRALHIVKTDDGNVFGNADAFVFQRADGPGRKLVACGEDSGKVPAAKQKFFHAIGPEFRIVLFYADYPAFVPLYAGGGKGVIIAFDALAAERKAAADYQVDSRVWFNTPRLAEAQIKQRLQKPGIKPKNPLTRGRVL